MRDVTRKMGPSSGIYLFTVEESTRELYERFGYTTVETKHSGGVVAYHMSRPNERVRRDNH